MIEVVAIPPLATVQDLGRNGHWREGIGRAGAMDDIAHRLANLMLRNQADAATLEIPMGPAVFRFQKRQAFAIAGGICGARLDARALPRTWAGVAEPGQVLTLGAITEGARVYLAVPGGIDVPEILGSRSTQLREAFGGFEGRVLAAGDVLKAAGEDPVLPQSGLSIALPLPRREGQSAIALRALPSTEHDAFSPETQAAFWSKPYKVTAKGNRQGYRLEGPELARTGGGELRSHGIVPGVVQVPGGGQPIIQLADSATMGGYPKIAAVIEQDLWRIAQARPGDEVQFTRITLAEAAEAEREQRAFLAHFEAQLAGFAAQNEGWA